MSNIEIIRNKVRFHVRDVYNKEADLDQIILQTIEDISNETQIFKKVIGFTIQKDKNLYDFRDICRMNEQVEVELAAVTIGEPSTSELIAFLQDPTNFPDPTIIKDVFVETDGESMFINLLDVFDENGVCISPLFHNHGAASYYVYNDEWLKDNDGVTKAFTASVIPQIDELLPEDLAYIMSTIIEGCKYYYNDTFASASDAQVANIFYQRYWQRKQALINQFPTKIFSIPGKKSWP